MKSLGLSRYALAGVGAALLAACGAMQPPIVAQAARVATHRLSTSYQRLYAFHPPRDGARPLAALLDVNGTLYGTTYSGGLSGKGTVYRVTTSGAHKVIYRFRGGADGRNPQSGLIDVKGTLYGTTYGGGGGTACYAGNFSTGTVYSISTSGVEKVLYAFKGGSDGCFPVAGLVDLKGTLYGTTWMGGHCYTTVGCGTVFSITTSGTEKVLHSFGGNGDGAWPFGSLIAVNGTLYGTTNSPGTVFRISTSGKEKVLHSFGGGSDDDGPYAGLLDVNGTLYGTTEEGGGTQCYSGAGCGTVFSITTSGQEALLHAFHVSDGSNPDGALIDVNGVLYGTTNEGGAHGYGTVYSVSISGVEQVLHSFGSRGDGYSPVAGVTDLNGTLYGTTQYGGRRHGTVFALTP